MPATVPITIHVPLQIHRFDPRTDDGLVECWGFVGDYEVMTCISWKHAIEEGLYTDKEWAKLRSEERARKRKNAAFLKQLEGMTK